MVRGIGIGISRTALPLLPEDAQSQQGGSGRKHERRTRNKGASQIPHRVGDKRSDSGKIPRGWSWSRSSGHGNEGGSSAGGGGTACGGAPGG